MDGNGACPGIHKVRVKLATRSAVATWNNESQFQGINRVHITKLMLEHFGLHNHDMSFSATLYYSYSTVETHLGSGITNDYLSTGHHFSLC